MPDPKVIEPGLMLPEEWRRKYEARSAPELAQDVIKLFEWKRTSERDKNLILLRVHNLEKERNWFLAIALLDFLGILGLFVWVFLGG